MESMKVNFYSLTEMPSNPVDGSFLYLTESNSEEYPIGLYFCSGGEWVYLMGAGSGSSEPQVEPQQEEEIEGRKKAYTTSIYNEDGWFPEFEEELTWTIPYFMINEKGIDADNSIISLRVVETGREIVPEYVFFNNADKMLNITFRGEGGIEYPPHSLKLIVCGPPYEEEL